MLKFIALFAVTTMTLGFVGRASGCRTKRNSASSKTETRMKEDSSELKVLAEGFHSSITHPFVAVVRDSETYEAILRLDGNLPRLDSDYFKSHIVVTAFLGERNTGGYGVQITQSAAAIRILAQKPGKGVILPQMTT